MPGGRKHNKKRRKKNWRSVLEGCFNKNPFSAPTSEGSQKVNEKPQAGKDSPKRTSDIEDTTLSPEPRQQGDESFVSTRSEDVPIRGILKKSQTTSSVASGIYAEAAVDVPDALLHSLRPEAEWSQVRPAYLLNNTSNQGSFRSSNGSNCAFPIQAHPSNSCKSSPETLLSSQLKSRPRPNSYHEGDFCSRNNSPFIENPYSTPDVVHRRLADSSNHCRPNDASRPSNNVYNDPYRQPTYYNVRDRQQESSADVDGYLESPVYSRPAYMRYELDQAYAHPLQAVQRSHTDRHLSLDPQRSPRPHSVNVDPDPVYVKLEQIQQRKLEQKAQQRERKVSPHQQQQQQQQYQSCDSTKGQKYPTLLCPPSSWHGAVIMAANSAPPARRKLLPMLEYNSPSSTRKLSPKDDRDSKATSSSRIPIASMWKEIDSEVEVYNCTSPKSSPTSIKSKNVLVSRKQLPDMLKDSAPSLTNDREQSSLKSSRYVTSALPRSRDPIRKPMGSRSSLSPNNPLARALPVGVRDWSSKKDLLPDDPHPGQTPQMYGPQIALQAAQTAAASFMAVGTYPSTALDLGPKDQTVEVSSQIYATVTRSSKCKDGSSYVYTSSVSWRKKEKPPRTRARASPNVSYNYSYSDEDDDEFYPDRSRGPPRHIRDSSPYLSPPPLPPRRWSPRGMGDIDPHYSGALASTDTVGGYSRVLEAQYNKRQYNRQSAYIEQRPPLPSYEEIIESRIRYGQTRPVSWCGFGSQQKTDQKREAFMQLLAQRYPQYADRIQGMGTGSPGERTASSSSASPSPQPEAERPARSRDVQRRRTAVLSYDPVQAAQTLEYDDLGTMSDLELPSFQRGGFMRTSLPIVRSASTSLEKPLGLVFLVCGDQTKKSLLPNEITTLDTVRALFVRAFPDLSLEMLESPRRKIYILDPATNIYFQLEDLAEIKDRSVLKLHETDSLEPQRVKERQEVRGRTVQIAPPRPHGRQQPIYEVPGGPDIYSKPGSLPMQPSPQPHPYQQDQWDPTGRRSRSRTPEPVERPRSLSAGAASRQRISHSPDRMVTPGGTLNPIPENRQFLAHPAYRKDHPMPPPSVPPPLPGYYENDDPAIYGVYGVQGNGAGHYSLPAQPVLYENAGMVYHDGYAVPPALAAAAQQQQTYVARSTRAPALAHAQRAVGPGPDMRDGSRSGSGRPSPVYSSPSDSMGGTYQQKRAHSHDRRDDASSRNRIEKMEQQLATLTAWVHLQKAEEGSGMGPRRDVPPPSKSMGSLPSTASGSSETFPCSTSSSTSDVTQSHGNHALMRGSSASSVSRSDTSTPVPTMSAGLEAKTRLAELRSDLQILKRQQQLNIEALREEISSAMNQIQKVINSVPGAESKVLVHKRTQVTFSKGSYLSDKQQVDKELSDLEASVEEQRNDVLSRRCRVNIVDVEGMALLLSNITKSLADLKARFPEVQSQMKDVMDAEMRVVVSEEKFLKTEPSEIERSLKRCKNLTQTLYTLKRLASAQDLQPPHIPSMPQAGVEETELSEQKHAVLESIKAMIPDHQQRVEQMEATEASRERKKKISTQQEALKFGKSLEMASKQLRPSHSSNTQGESENLNSGNNAAMINKEYNEKVVKPPVAAKPDLINSAQAATPMPYTSSSSSLQPLPSAHPAHAQTVPPPASSSSPKPFYSGALTTSAATASRVSEKPTATVSAMTSHASDSITTTAAKSSNYDTMVPSSPSQTAVKKQHGVSNNVSGGTGTVTQTVYRVQTPVSQRADADISTYQVCGPVNPVIPSSLPVATKASSLPGSGNSHSSLYGSSPGAVLDMAVKDSFENPIPAVNGVSPRKSCLSSSSSSPPTSPVEPGHQAGKKPSVTFAESKPNIQSSPCHKSTPGNDAHTKDSSEVAADNRQTNAEKFDLATQKQAARNAFFSSMNTPPVSPASPSDRSSAILDPSPVLSPTSGVVGTSTPGSTINLVLAGSASPKSTSHPGTFNISPPAEISPSGLINLQTSEHPKKFFIASSPSSKKSPTLIPPRQSSLDSNLPPQGTAPLASVDTSSSSSESEYSGAKPKKVPPPPPPRRGSRPTSFSGMPCLSNNSSPTHKPGEMPRFVGGILGQHRLSGGPLSSTPKSGDYQDRPAASIFEKDLAAGIYANMNRPDLQNQKSTPQQIISKAGGGRANGTKLQYSQGTGSEEKPGNGSVSSNYEDSPPIPPPPSVVLGSTNRQERGSSSESTSSSSSTSMGSQQSVVNVVRAQSMHCSPSSSGGSGRHGTKPPPPKRQSSLLAKFTGSNKNSNNAEGKGVDL